MLRETAKLSSFYRFQQDVIAISFFLFFSFFFLTDVQLLRTSGYWWEGGGGVSAERAGC